MTAGLSAVSHAAITGASGGIGRALAREFSRQGYAVSLIGRQRAALEAIASELPGRAHVVEIDLSRSDCVTNWIAKAEAVLGPIDVLVNNAGAVVAGSFPTIDRREARDVIDLDLVVPLELSRAVLPDMLARGCGVIVNIASTGALGPNPGMVDYCAAKAGLAAASESLRGELRGSGVHIVTVYPGPIATRMLERAHEGYPRSRLVTRLPTGEAVELARRVRVAVERRRARVIYPRVYALFRYLPWVARWLLDRLTPPPVSSSAGPGREFVTGKAP
jgi:short-subunit dehydrogenase